MQKRSGVVGHRGLLGTSKVTEEERQDFTQRRKGKDRLQTRDSSYKRGSRKQDTSLLGASEVTPTLGLTSSILPPMGSCVQSCLSSCLGWAKVSHRGQSG